MPFRPKIRLLSAAPLQVSPHKKAPAKRGVLSLRNFSTIVCWVGGHVECRRSWADKETELWRKLFINVWDKNEIIQMHGTKFSKGFTIHHPNLGLTNSLYLCYNIPSMGIRQKLICIGNSISSSKSCMVHLLQKPIPPSVASSCTRAQAPHSPSNPKHTLT